MTQAVDQEDFYLPDLCQTQNILFLVLIAELLVLVLVLYDTAAGHFDWTTLALSSLFVQWLALSSAAILCKLRLWLARFSVLWATAFAFSLILLVTLTYSLAAELLLYDSASVLSGRLFRNLVMVAIVTGIAFRYFYLTHRLRRQEQAELTSRIQALQSRIRPHFLFNSMNIIASLIPMDPEVAEEVVEDLSVLFRASLNETTSEPVSLAEELDLCRKYLHIEGLRLDERLTVEWQLDSDPTTLKIPLLTLQPLLENAIYHGIQPLPEGGTVAVQLSSDETRVCISITNPVSQGGSSHESGNRMALENIRHRMQAIYGPGASLNTESDEHRFTTHLIYPKVD